MRSLYGRTDVYKRKLLRSPNTAIKIKKNKTDYDYKKQRQRLRIRKAERDIIY